MADLLFVGILLGFFALAALFVEACDRVIGHEEHGRGEGSAPDPTEEEEVAA